MGSTSGSPQSHRASGVWKSYDVLPAARVSFCCQNVGWWNVPLRGSGAVGGTVGIMSAGQTQANRCCASVLFTSCSSDSNPPMSIHHSTTELQHRRLFGEPLSSLLDSGYSGMLIAASSSPVRTLTRKTCYIGFPILGEILYGTREH